MIEDIELELFFSPAQDNSGSPNINSEIKEKIRTSDIVVADLTNISKLDEFLISNPNVMYEIGLADTLIGEERIILLCEKSVNITKLAFDINHQRISQFNINNNNFYIQLCEWIKSSLIESEKQNFLKRYFINNIISDIEILFNYFLDFAYSKRYKELNEKNMSFDEKVIRNNFMGGEYSEIKLLANMTWFVNNFEDKLYKLNGYVERGLFIKLVNLVQYLKEYNFLFNNINPFEKKENKKNICNILSHNSFKLNDADKYEKAMNSIYFRSDIVIINRKFDGNIYILTNDMINGILRKDRIFSKKLDPRFKIGEEMTFYDDDLYVVKNINVDNHVNLISKILNLIVDICANLNIEFNVLDTIVYLRRS